MTTKRLDRNQAKKLAIRLADKALVFSKHALQELKNDDLTLPDVLNVIKSPDSRIVKPPEFENGSWRYRFETKRICVVIAFASMETLVVVTAWRKT